MDALSELAPNYTPYRYGFSNPAFFSDASGQFETENAAGEYLKANKILGATVEFDTGSQLWKIYVGDRIITQIGNTINTMYNIGEQMYLDQAKAGGGKSTFQRGLRTVADITPFIGGAWDVIEGFENGDYLQVSIGAGSLILDAATMGVGGTILKGGLKTVIKVGAEELAEQSIKKSTRGLWKLTEEGASVVKQNKRFGKFYKNKTNDLWWQVDKAGHGQSKFKVFKETDKGLEWYRDADEFGDFIINKHKGPTGRSIPWNQLN